MFDVSLLHNFKAMGFLTFLNCHFLQVGIQIGYSIGIRKRVRII